MVQYISIFTHLIPLILLLFFHRKNKGLGLRVLFVYCLYTFINDVLLIVFKKSDTNITFFLLSLFTVIEFLLFAVLFYLRLKNEIFKKIILFAIPLFLGFTIIQFLNSSEKTIDSLSITIEYIIIIIFCLFYFFEEIVDPQVTFIYSTQAFWVIAGILIYSTGTFFLFMFSENLSDDEWDKWSIINYVFTILKNTSFSIAVIMKESSLNLPSIENENEPLQQTPLTPLNSNP